MPKEDDPKTNGGSEKPNEPQRAGQGSPSTSGASAAGSAGQTGGQPGEKSAGATPAGQGRGAENEAQRASALLKADHQQVEKLFAEFESADDRRKDEIIEQACQDLILHTLVEEEIFYPACRAAASDEEPLDEAQVEHDSAKLLIVELLDGRRDDEFRQAKFKVLAEQIRHHVAEEEKPRTGIFAKAQAAGIDTPELGHRIQQRKQQVQSRGALLRPTRPASLQSLQRLAGAARPMEEYGMPRNYGPERDERGRFMSDDDRDDRRRYGAERYEGRRRYADDDDDDRRYRARGGDRDRGQGGWFGDPEGHSEAARRGWDNPDHGPSGWYGDSRGHAEASRRGWDNPDHAPSGWFGDSRGHSEASRRGWDNPDHGRSGWYGDPEGHSEASRRGWDERRSFSGRDRDYDRDDDRGRGRARDEEGRFRSRDDDDDDRRYRSRSRDDDDDRRSSRGRGRDDDDRGQGGWFGDSRGHSEAARRGWDHRR